MKKNVKRLVIGLLIIWVLLFVVDSTFGISWPNYTIERIFIWIPTVLVGVYWLFFGGASKRKGEE